MAEENFLLALLRGVRSKYMKHKLNAACLVSMVSFEAAVQLATRIEGVEEMMSDSEVPIVSILKQTTFSDRATVHNPLTSRRSSSSEGDENFQSRTRDFHRSRSPTRENRCSWRGRNRSSPSSRQLSGRGHFRGRSDRDLTCWNCLKKGHVQANCWSRRNSNRGARGNRGRSGGFQRTSGYSGNFRNFQNSYDNQFMPQGSQDNYHFSRNPRSQSIGQNQWVNRGTFANQHGNFHQGNGTEFLRNSLN